MIYKTGTATIWLSVGALWQIAECSFSISRSVLHKSIVKDGNGKTIYADVFSLAKPLLMKLATAAGIQFHPEYTTVTKENINTYVGKAYGAVRLPDGTFKTHAETKRICLDDEEAKYHLEFMDKSIMGITDWKATRVL